MVGALVGGDDDDEDYYAEEEEYGAETNPSNQRRIADDRELDFM